MFFFHGNNYYITVGNCHSWFYKSKSFQHKLDKWVQAVIEKTEQWLLSSNLHGSGAHVGEDFFSGSGILVITERNIETLLHVGKAEKRF